MSLILEALRRSEADRRRAQAPDLFAGPQLAARAAPVTAPRWLWPTLGVFALVATAWLARAWWMPAPAAATDVATPPPVADIPAVHPAPQVSPPTADVAAAPAQPSAAAPLPAPSPAPSPAAVPAPASADPPTVATLPPPASLPAAPPPAPTVAAPIVVAPPAPATAMAAPAAAAPLLLSDLGHAERQALPPLKLSMHMWHDAPSQRFAIVDGQRVGEGDRLGDAVVARIAEDGVVLAWRGREVKLPLP